VNCTEAQALLAAYRELKNEKVLPLEPADPQGGKSGGLPRRASAVAGSHFKVDTTELDVHLEQCASCRQVLARNSLILPLEPADPQGRHASAVAGSHFNIGDKLSALPAIELPSEMHEKLMHRLANEHVRFLHREASRTPSVPEFLKPYLRKQAQHVEKRDLLTAFSTAETGPLPIIHVKRKRPRHPHMSQFAVVGLAAMFLMMLMMGGLASLLLLGHGKLASTTDISHYSLNQPSNVAEAKYTTNTLYSHVVSAVADRSNIYYTAYTDGANNPWMLEQLDRKTHVSTPLLEAPSANPLIVLGSSDSWLVWLELDDVKAATPGNKYQHPARSFTRTWSLHYLSLTARAGTRLPTPPGTAPAPTNSLTLFGSTFNESVAPNWVSTPVQGIWFLQDSLLVAMIDKSGNSHLMLFELGSGSNLTLPGEQITPVEIATASPGHVFTSPTATSDGTSIYWSDEWRSEDGSLHSNIWTQQLLESARPAHGAWIDHATTVKYLFRSDGMSFRPQVADDALFLLSTANPTNSTQATATTIPTPALTTSVDTTPAIARVDPSIYGVSPDDAVQGAVLMLPISGDLSTLPTQMNKAGQASSLQVGADFAVWQSEKGYEMYDVRTGYVTIGQDVLNGARFLAVNGNTATWVAGSADNGTNNTTPSSVTLLAFNWPEA